MLDIKKTIRNTTLVFIICILLLVFFEVAPIIEDKFYDRYFIVTFDLGIGDSFEVMVSENHAVVKPETPQKEGYKFIGWYYKDSEYDFTTYVNKNIRVYAYWEKKDDDNSTTSSNKIKVIFDVVGGTLIADQEIVKGGTASIPLNPSREGYTFVDWQVNGKKFDFGTNLYEDTTIVAVWKEN